MSMDLPYVVIIIQTLESSLEYCPLIIFIYFSDDNTNCLNEDDSRSQEIIPCHDENNNVQNEQKDLKDNKVKCTSNFYIENLSSNVKVKNNSNDEKHVSELYDSHSSDQSTKCFSECLSAVSILSVTFDEDGSIQIAPNCSVTQKEFGKMITSKLEKLTRKKKKKHKKRTDN